MTTHGPMVLHRDPLRHSPSHSPSTARLQAREPQLKPTPDLRGPQAPDSRNLNTGNGVLTPTPPRPFIRKHVDSEGTIHLVPSDATPRPPNSGSEVSQSRNPNQPSSEPRSRPPFSPYGIPACRTTARYNEICVAYVNPTSWCSWGYRCHRVHPLDREPYRRKMQTALTVDCSVAAPGPGQDKEETLKDVQVTPDLSSSLLLSDSSKPPPPLQKPSIEVIDLTRSESDQVGWDSNGFWKATPDAGSWTGSPSTNNDPLFSNASGSSSPTTASPQESDDEKKDESEPEETSEPEPAPVNSRHWNSPVCVLYKKRGSCPRGNDCIFRHVQDLPPKPPSPRPEKKAKIPAQVKTSVVPTPKAPVPPAAAVSVPPVPIVPIPVVPTPPTTAKPIPSTTANPIPLTTAKPVPPTTAKPVLPTTAKPVPSTTAKPVPPITAKPVSPAPAVPDQPTRPVAPAGPQKSSVAPQRVRNPRPQSNLLCRRWLQNTCSYGHACRFVHGDLEYDDEPVEKVEPTPVRMDEFLLSFTLHDHMRVQCSAGFDIQRVQTAFESSTLLVSNISPRVRPNHLRQTLSSYGIVEDLRMPATLSAGTVVKVIYSDAAEAQKAQNALNGTKMYDLTINAKVANSGQMKTATDVLLKDTTIRISWEAPAKEVFAGYSTKAQADRAIEIARDSPLNGHYLRGEIYEGMPAVDVVNVRFRGVPVDVDKADLVRFVNPVDIMWTRPNYTDFEDTVRFIKYRLQEFGPENVEILPPPYRDGGMVRAWASFPNASRAKEAARRLDARRPKCTGYTSIRATHVQSLSYQISSERWSKLGVAIDSLQAAQRLKLVAVNIVSRDNGGRFVRLSGDDQKELAHLKNQFEKILRGEAVCCDGKLVYDSYFTRREGLEFLRDLATKNPTVHYENDPERFCIRLHGYAVDRSRFASAIVTKVKEFRSQKRFEIPLRGRLLGAAITDRELKDLRLKYGTDNAFIEIQKGMLVIRGDFGLFQKFNALVDQIGQRLPKASSYVGPTCPICFDKPSLPIRLQCGHHWCRGCMSHYFQSAKEQRTFPLKCLGKDGRCGMKIPIGVAKEVLSRIELDATANAAFLAHVSTRPKEFHFCPTSDCPQVYRTTLEKTTLQCPSCLTSFCTRCHSEAHGEFQCSDQVQDELFKKWTKDHDVKQCPTCDALIEKMEGCNHMTCSRCQTHICWQCMKTFPGGEGIYGHMREVHGTFGLGQVFD